MSQFLEKHPRLAIAFDGAKRGLKMYSVPGYGLATTLLTEMAAGFGVAGAALAPAAVGALALCAGFNASAGAVGRLNYERNKAMGKYGSSLKPSKIPYPLKKQ